MRLLLCGLLAAACATPAPSAAPSSSRAGAGPPPLLLRGGALHTLDSALPLADSALIVDGLFACVGALATCSAQAPPGTRTLDLRGGSATPGLTDAHLHVRGLGRTLVDLYLRGVPGEAEACALAKAYATKVPAGRWIRGRGWDQTRWPGKSWPTQDSLSAALPAHPAWLRRIDGHAGWGNAQALSLAGITDRTPDPAGGRILRDARGHATGVLIDAAMELVEEQLPPLTPEETEGAILAALRKLVEAGFTSVHDLGMGPQTVALYRRLADEDRLPLRVVGALDDAPLAELVKAMSEQRALPPQARFDLRHVKLYADGALGSRGALLSEPYADEPGNSGLAQQSEDELREKSVAIARAGLHPAAHCIGDLACARVLRAFAAARREVPAVRPRAEHLQVLHRATCRCSPDRARWPRCSQRTWRATDPGSTRASAPPASG